MKAAEWPRDRGEEERLLVVDARDESLRDARVGGLPGLLAPGDVLVVNDAATLPAALRAATERGDAIELRLAAPPRVEEGTATLRVALLGPGELGTRTEDRPAPPALASGERLRMAGEIAFVREASGREATLAVARGGSSFWRWLYSVGRPVQYAHVRAPLAAWHVQTAFAARPWASEQPSAGRPLTWDTLLALRRRGIAIASVTHAAGLSSVDGGAYDATLPRPEAYEIPPETVETVERARAAGSRVVAVGTTVVRALEGAALAHGGVLAAGGGTTELVIGPEHRRRVVGGLLTGLHEPGSSHFRLLEGFAPRGLLARALDHASREGYLSHELGDSALVLA